MESENREKIAIMEQHLRLLKDTVNLTSLDILEIKAALIGTNLNNNRGMVHEVDDPKERVEEIEKELSKKQGWMDVLKIAVAILVGFVVNNFIKILSLG
jgi:hypothetical protein